MIEIHANPATSKRCIGAGTLDTPYWLRSSLPVNHGAAAPYQSLRISPLLGVTAPQKMVSSIWGAIERTLPSPIAASMPE